MKSVLLAVTLLLVGLPLVACKGLGEEDYARLNELFHQSQTRPLTPAEVEEIQTIWDKRGGIDWEGILAMLLSAAGLGGAVGAVGVNKYRNIKRLKRGEPV